MIDFDDEAKEETRVEDRYDAVGNLTERIDRNGRVIEYAYDDGDRMTTESWFADVNDATADREIEFAYDLLGRLFTSSDADHENIYVYERRDLDVATTVLGGALTGLETAFWFYNDYDAVGNRTYAQVSMDVVDFVNTYAYDNLHRLTSVVQSDQGYSAVVTDKRVDFTYDLAGQLDTIKRYASTSTASPVAVTDYDYDRAGRVTEIDHRSGSNPAGGTQLAGYGYVWNGQNQLTSIDFLPTAYNGEDVAYDYDNRHQLESATYGSQSNETYAYDDNGNRTSGGFTVGDNNQLLDDGTYDYEYDDEGNRTKRIHQTTYDSTVYVWDHRNRLVEVRDYDGNNTSSTGDDTLIQEVDYAYDADNQIVKRVVDVAGATPIEQTFYLWENGQILLQLDKTGAGDLNYQDLSHRYLWGPLVDQLLADEQVDWTDSDPDGEVLWALTDHLGTVRDIVNNSATVVDHAEYSAFGKRLDPAAVDVVFGFTGHLFDDATGDWVADERRYDPRTGEWLSPDPIGFAAGDANIERYAGNSPTMFTDPDGLHSAELPDGTQYGGGMPWSPSPGAQDFADEFFAFPLPPGFQSTDQRRAELQYHYDFGGPLPHWARGIASWRAQQACEHGQITPLTDEEWQAARFAALSRQVILSDEEQLELDRYRRQPYLDSAYLRFELVLGIGGVFSGKPLPVRGPLPPMVRPQPGPGRPYDVGPAYALRRSAPPNQTTSVHHGPGRRWGRANVTGFNDAGRAGNEPAIRLPCEEHDAVSAAQRLLRVPSGARQGLADEIRILRTHSNAPNSALQELIRLNRDIHPWDYYPIHRWEAQ